MLAAYLLDPARRTYELVELAADAGIGLRPSRRAGRRRDDGGEDGSARAGEERGRAASRPRRRGSSPSSPERQRELDEWGLERLLREVELPLVEVLAAMERRGSSSTPSGWPRSARASRERDREARRREIYELAGREFTIGSPQQVGKVLFEELGLTTKRRGKTGFSTDARVLAQIRDEHEIVAKIESWRELTKLKSTYLDTLPELIDPDDGRIHTTFNQAATTTGRLSSTNPNLQNIPIRTELGRPIRSCFVAERGRAAALGRLQPGRAAGPGPRRRRGGPAGDLQRGRGRPRGDRGGGLRASPARRSTSASARRRRWSTSGSSTG